MIDIEHIPIHSANDYNYKRAIRNISQIKYVIIHYTANVDDTPQDNCAYFAREKVECSAHYFVRDGTILQSVPLDHAAFSVGDKSNPNKASMRGFIDNFNSVSIELCGSSSSTEASDHTKQTGAMLAASLCHYLNLKPDRVFRHYDVSGKQCPYWAVNESEKWFLFLSDVHKYYMEELKGMGYTTQEYEKFRVMMDAYLAERAHMSVSWGQQEADRCREYLVIKEDSRPQSWVTRRELQAVVSRILGLLN